MLHGPLSHLAIGEGAAVRLDPRYGPFAAARDTSEESQRALANLLREENDELWLVETEEWPAPAGLQTVASKPLLQMIADGPYEHDTGADTEIEKLGESDAGEMAEIALATEPGPWAELTHRYLNAYGIRIDGKLAAMAGQRMVPDPGLIEVSGVCTWPEFRGQGLATKLIKRVMKGIRERGAIPFLHSYSGNTGAIALYESLGFRSRSAMIATVLKRTR